MLLIVPLTDFPYPGREGHCPLRRLLGHEGGALIDEISALIVSFHHVKMQQEMSSVKPTRGLSPKPNHAGALASDFQPPELGEISFRCV